MILIPAHSQDTAVNGLTDITSLLHHMSPRLHDGEFVFCTLPTARYGDLAELAPLASFQEAEGLTLVLRKEQADEHGLNYGASFRAITLDVHSSLEAVGLTAAVATQLASAGISANVIAAFYHDHIFVPAHRAQEALAALIQLTQE